MRKTLVLLGVVFAGALVAVLAIDPFGVYESDAPAEGLEPERPDRVTATGRGGESGEASRAEVPAVARVSVSGRVWRAGVPAAAHVEAFSLAADGAADAAKVAAADAGTSGTFRLRDLAVGSYELRAIARDGAACTAVVRIRYPAERVAVDLTIPSGPHTLRGRVVYADKRPFRGFVTVTPTGNIKSESSAAAIETDEQGRFAAPWIEAGMVRVRCTTGADFQYAGRVIRIPHAGEILIVVDRGAVELAGRVTAEESGKPVAGATVMVQSDTGENRSCVVRARTDEDGRFRLRVFPCRRQMEVRAAGFSPVVRSIERDERSVTIQLGRTGTVAGRVLSATSRAPLAGVPVLWVPLDPRHLLGGGRVISGVGGQFSLAAVPNGRVVVYAMGGGWVSPDLCRVVERGANPLVATIEPGAVAQLDLLVIRAVRIRGKVVDARGSAVPGVPVRVKRFDECEALSQLPCETVSGPRGGFAFDCLAPDTPHYLEASPAGRNAVRSAILTGAAGAQLEVTLEVAAEDSTPRWLDLMVVELASGEPIAGAEVSVGIRSGRTATNGRARLGPVKPGRISVWAYHPDCALLQDRPLVEASATGLIPVTVRLRRGLAIGGRVFLPDGRPLESGTVWVQSVDADNAAPAHSEIGKVTAQGRFRAGGLLTGQYDVKIRGTSDLDAYGVEAVAKAGDEDLVLTAGRRAGKPPTRLFLRVVDPQGQPVPAATAEFRYEGNGQAWSNDFPVLAGRVYCDFYGTEGSVTISVHGARTLSGARLPLGPVLEGPMPLAAQTLTIRLPAERAITGVVHATGGAGVAGVKLTAAPAYAEDLDFCFDHAIAFTDAKGAFRLGGLGKAEYRISVAAPNEFLPVEPVPAKAGAADLKIEMRRGAACRLTVVGPGAVAVPGARIDVEEYDGRSFTFFTRRDGVAVLRGIDKDQRNTLKVSPPSGRRELLDVTRKDWRPGDATIPLGSGLPVAGVVRDPDGRPAAGVIVHAHSRQGRWLEHTTARDGSFRLGPFRPGPVLLSTRWPGVPWPRTPNKVEVTAGQEDVVLTAKAGESLTVRILNWNAAFGPARARLSGAGLRWTVVERDGTATFRGLPAKRDFTVWVGPVGDGLYLLRNVPAGLAVVDVSLVRGGTLSGRLTWPPAARNPAVRIDGSGYSMVGAVEKDGSFRFLGLPEGRCVVTAWAMLEGRRIQSHAWTQPGKSVEIVLETDAR